MNWTVQASRQPPELLRTLQPVLPSTLSCLQPAQALIISVSYPGTIRVAHSITASSSSNSIMPAACSGSQIASYPAAYILQTRTTGSYSGSPG